MTTENSSTKRISFIAPTVNTNKEDEIANVRNIGDAVAGSGSYLEMLFTEEFVNWVCGKIANDFVPNIYEAYDKTCKESDLLMKNLLDRQAEIAELKDKVALLKYSVTTIEDSRKVLYQELFETRRAVDNAQESRDGYKKELAKAMLEINDLQLQVIALKPKLYDILVETQ